MGLRCLSKHEHTKRGPTTSAQRTFILPYQYFDLQSYVMKFSLCILTMKVTVLW